MDNTEKSVLFLESLAFEKIDYSRDLTVELSSEYEMNFSRSVIQSDDGNHYKVCLNGNIWTPNKSMSLSLTLVGIYSCDCDDEETKKNLLLYNSVAIMFPYLRSQVTLVTSQPNMTPVVLPVFNIVELFQNSDKEMGKN